VLNAAQTPSGWADWRGSPKDVARWLFWVKLRNALDPERPERIARAWPLWRVQYASARGQRALMADEFRRWRGDAPESLLAEAYRIAFRVHLEELLLGKLTPQNWSKWMRLEGREQLDGALARGRGAVLLFPHAGNFMLMHAVMGLAGYTYTQYAARGMAPPQVAAAHAEVFANNKWRREARAAREINEDRLPITFISLDTPVRHLFRCLARNECVGIAFDGRIGAKWTKAPYLDRVALLSTGPYKLATATGAAVVPVYCECPEGDVNICRFGEPIVEHEPERLMRRFLADAVEPWLDAHPAHYGIWLAHCRERAAVDDHPFFIDYAPDERWKRWDGEGRGGPRASP
jgi:KDO2-lipid IV(A) lauroyltransferase